jgi:DnaJ-class molecular chaperone
VDPSADQKTIKTSYYKLGNILMKFLAKKYHPDVYKGKEDTFKGITEAY